jgi:hypothetical protein
MPSYVFNVADAPAFEHPVSGVRILLESPDAELADTGINAPTGRAARRRPFGLG